MDTWVIVLILIVAAFGLLSFGYWIAGDDPAVLRERESRAHRHSWEDHNVDRD